MLKHIVFLFIGLSFYVFSYAANYVIIHPSNYTLELYDDEETLIKTYSVGLGRGGMGKTKMGDCKTPTGEYKILWKASSHWQKQGGFPIIEGKSYCGYNNSFSTESRDGFSDEPVWGNDFGGDETYFMCLDYPSSSDQIKGFTGFGIAIHGTLLGGIGEASSRGCIRMYPNDARELYDQLQIGSVVFINAN